MYLKITQISAFLFVLVHSDPLEREGEDTVEFSGQTGYIPAVLVLMKL